MRIRTRLLLGLLAIFAAGAYFLLDPILDRLEQQYLEAVEEPMVDIANILAASVERELVSGTIPTRTLAETFDRAGARQLSAKIYDVVKTRVVMRVYVTDANGIVLYDSDNGREEGQDLSSMRDVALTLRGGYGARSSQGDPKDSLSSMMYVGAPIQDVSGQIVGVLSVAKPQRSVEEFIAVSRTRIVLGALGTGAALTLAAWLLSHWVTIPIRRLTDYANAVKAGERVPMPKLAGIEVRTLGKAFEEMRDALEGRRYAENYIQTLTHEIKSPLSAIRGASELLEETGMPQAERERFLGNIRTETARIQRITDQLLRLATVESQKALTRRNRVGVVHVVDKVVESTRSAAEMQGVGLEIAESDAGAIAEIDATLVEMALANLVQNAIEFSRAGSVVRISTVADAENVQLIVEDEGEGIPAFALPRVFERFYSLQRPGSARKSSGLGLCFVREVADLHGGEVTLENRECKGARAVLCLPRQT